MMPPSWFAATKKRALAVVSGETSACTASATARMPATPAALFSTNHTEPKWRVGVASVSAGPGRSSGGARKESCPARWPGVLGARGRGARSAGGRGVCRRALADAVALLIAEVARLDELLRVVPRAAAVVEDGGQEDAGHGADHQHRGLRLPAQDQADEDRRAHRERPRKDHVAQGR